MAPIAKIILSIFLASSLVAATPIQRRGNHSDTPAATVQYDEVLPEIYNIWTNETQRQGEGDGIYLEAWRELSQVENINVFTIPPGAKNCKVDLRIANDKKDRIFVPWASTHVDGIEYQLRQVEGIQEPINYANVKQHLDPSVEWVKKANLDNWNEYGFPNQHSYKIDNGKPINCAEKVYIWNRLADSKDERTLYIKQDANNGVFVSYYL